MKRTWVVAALVIFILLIGCSSTFMDNFMLGQGMGEFNKGEYDKAIPDLKKAAESNPKDGWNYWRLGVAYCNNKQYQEAVEAFKRYFDLPHDKQNEWIAWEYLADAYDGLGQTAQAISATKKRIELTPDSSYGYVKLSKLYKDSKQYDEAIVAAKRAIELKPEHEVAHGYLGVVYGMKKQYDDAMKELSRAADLDPQWSDLYGWMGHFSIENAAFHQAAAAYRKEVAIKPSPDGYRRCAIANFRMGRYDDAVAAVNQAIELQTMQGGVGVWLDAKNGHTLVKGLMNNGPAYRAGIQTGDTIQEIDGKGIAGWKVENVTACLRGTAGSPVVLTIARDGNSLKKSVTREKIVLKEAASGIAIRSLISRHKGALSEAFNDAGTASTLNPSSAYAALSLGAAYLDRGQFEEAIKLLSTIQGDASAYDTWTVPFVVQLFCDARVLEATAYAKQGKEPEAATIYNAVPEDAWSPKNIPQTEDRAAFLQAVKPFVKKFRDSAAVHESNGHYQEALAELSKALKIADDTESLAIQEAIFTIINRDPSLAEVSDEARKYALRGEVLVKEGSFELAIAEFKKAIRLAPYSAQFYYNTAVINAELKRYSEAIRYMGMYCKAVPSAPNVQDAKDEIIKWEFMMEKGSKR